MLFIPWAVNSGAGWLQSMMDRDGRKQPRDPGQLTFSFDLQVCPAAFVYLTLQPCNIFWGFSGILYHSRLGIISSSLALFLVQAGMF